MPRYEETYPKQEVFSISAQGKPLIATVRQSPQEKKCLLVRGINREHIIYCTNYQTYSCSCLPLFTHIKWVSLLEIPSLSA